MRVMLDTNVLISLLLFPNARMWSMMQSITNHHRLVLSSFVIDELLAVTNRKFPAKVAVVDRLLSQLTYEMVYTPKVLKAGLFDIRDVKDYPVLYTAIVEDVDILITGDKDFADVAVEHPEIMTPAAFMDKYM